MPMIGVLGGLGPAATVDFLDKVIRLTPARCDQEHIPVLTASMPHVPDRSAAILGAGPDPLPALLRGVDLLNSSGVSLVAIPCNSAHHWYDQLSERSRAPIVHIGRACVARLQVSKGSGVLVLATRGALHSGFYQRALHEAGLVPVEADSEQMQPLVDDCIQQVKAGNRTGGGACLEKVLTKARASGVSAVIMGCTEIPIAAQHSDHCGLALADSTLTLAQAVVEHALHRGWNQPLGDAVIAA